jgi:hypothetical protein
MPSVPTREGEFLLGQQNPDGGWGYQSGGTSAVEATAWAMMALAVCPAPPPEALARARTWLVESQHPDGSWPAYPGQPQGCWATSLAARALHLDGGEDAAVTRARDWLLQSWPAEGTPWRRLIQRLFPSRVSRQNNALRGWSWTPGTASWVEPTALALLFLQSLPPPMLTPLAAKRRQLAERMLFDRMCPGGGWNSGNPLIYGAAGVPRVGPTVWALLALRDHADRPEIQASLAWLEGAYTEIAGPSSLALAHYCLRIYGRPAPPLAPWLDALYAKNHYFANILTAAWVVLAQQEDAAI